MKEKKLKPEIKHYYIKVKYPFKMGKPKRPSLANHGNPRLVPDEVWEFLGVKENDRKKFKK